MYRLVSIISSAISEVVSASSSCGVGVKLFQARETPAAIGRLNEINDTVVEQGIPIPTKS